MYGLGIVWILEFENGKFQVLNCSLIFKLGLQEMWLFLTGNGSRIACQYFLECPTIEVDYKLVSRE